jgi:hypothetical protein
MYKANNASNKHFNANISIAILTYPIALVGKINSKKELCS